MVCTTSCIIAGAFIFSSIFMTFRVNKQTISNPLFQLLNDKQKQKYMQITEERKNIYFKGFGLGFIISILSTLYT